MPRRFSSWRQPCSLRRGAGIRAYRSISNAPARHQGRPGGEDGALTQRKRRAVSGHTGPRRAVGAGRHSRSASSRAAGSPSYAGRRRRALWRKAVALGANPEGHRHLLAGGLAERATERAVSAAAAGGPRTSKSQLRRAGAGAGEPVHAQLGPDPAGPTGPQLLLIKSDITGDRPRGVALCCAALN